MKANFQYVSPMGWVIIALAVLWLVSHLPDMAVAGRVTWAVTKWAATVVAVALGVGVLLSLVALPFLWMFNN
jgi:hypothetical protein